MTDAKLTDEIPKFIPDMIVCRTPAIIELFIEELFKGWILGPAPRPHEPEFYRNGRVLTHPDWPGVEIPVMDFLRRDESDRAGNKVVCAYPVDLLEGWTSEPSAILTITLPREKRPQHPTPANLRECGARIIGYITTARLIVDHGTFWPNRISVLKTMRRSPVNQAEAIE